MRIRRTTLGVVSLVVLSAVPGAAASPADEAASPADEDATLYAGGHVHQLENDGFFFPGTTVCVDDDCKAITVLEVAQGSNVIFRNVDEEPHQVAADKKSKRSRRPLFFSKPIGQGEQTEIVTARLKPGTYPFHCEIHLPMRGTLVVE